jgi:3' terminal RNA ribose 2'-O-methyltransferase Hen1
MLLTITCEAENAADLGYLLHKNPANVFREKLWFGEIVVFYPEVEDHRCTAALLLNVDPIALIRGGNRQANGLDQYVNDRPYVASSLLSVGIATAFGSALNGRSRERPERVAEKLPLRAHIAALNCVGGSELMERLFAPLGYTVTTERAPLDDRFPDWGESSVYAVTLEGAQTVQDLLTHLYILIPALDNAKHYYVGAAEVEKLLAKGERWLAAHPEKELITRRYLIYRQAMVREAITRLETLREDAPETQEETDERRDAQESAAEEPLRLNEARMQAALAAVRSLDPPAARVLDLGCGEGRLLKLLLDERGLTELVGVDVAAHTLDRAAQRLHLDTLPERQKARIRLLQGSLVYQDERFAEFDVALLIEVIEHLDPPRLAALEQVVFRHARPRRVVVTTPNVEYNAAWPSLPAGRFRHRDHRFEWTRAEFAAWAERVALREGYTVAFQGVGTEDTALGCPTQMAIFDRTTATEESRDSHSLHAASHAAGD